MKENDPRARVWAEALTLLEEADRLRRQFFQLGTGHIQQPSWEPPIDIFEDDNDLLILVALPGVVPSQVEILVDDAVIVVRGIRRMPSTFRNATARRLEIPYGYFERRIELAKGKYEVRDRTLADGCLTLTLARNAKS